MISRVEEFLGSLNKRLQNLHSFHSLLSINSTACLNDNFIKNHINITFNRCFNHRNDIKIGEKNKSIRNLPTKLKLCQQKNTKGEKEINETN